MRIKQILIIIFVVIISGFFGYKFGFSQAGQFLKSIVQPGSMVTEASYVIFTDGSTVYARNGLTGEIEFSSTNASYVIQTAINTLSNNGNKGGSIYLKKSSNPSTYNIPSRYSISVDYIINSTISIPEGISIISDDGALLDVTSLNDTVLYFNPTTDTYFTKHSQLLISGLGFVGKNENTNTTAIHISRCGKVPLINNIMTTEVAYAIKIEGQAYRAVIQNSQLGGGGAGRKGKVGVYVFKGTGSTWPNALTIAHNDISSFEEGIKIEGGYGIKTIGNYLEDNNIGLNVTGVGSGLSVVGSYFQTGSGGTAIWSKSPVEVVSSQFLLGTNSYGIHSSSDYLPMSVSDNWVYCSEAGATFFYSPDYQSMAEITANNIQCAADTTAISGKISRGSIGNNLISGGNPSIRLTGSKTTIEGNHFYNSPLGINITGYDNQIHDNYFSNCQIDVELYANGNVIKDNYLTGSTNKIKIVQGTHTIKDNIGYITENSGVETVTASSTSVTVNHGLISTPKIVTVTPNWLTTFRVYGKTGTSFSVEFGTAAPSGAEIDWYAEV